MSCAFCLSARARAGAGAADGRCSFRGEPDRSAVVGTARLKSSCLPSPYSHTRPTVVLASRRGATAPPLADRLGGRGASARAPRRQPCFSSPPRASGGETHHIKPMIVISRESNQHALSISVYAQAKNHTAPHHAAPPLAATAALNPRKEKTHKKNQIKIKRCTPAAILMRH